MAHEPARPMTPLLGQGDVPWTECDLDDGQLLKRFVTARDEAAFATLMQRHGPMVLGVCRRLLRDQHEAEDAFQATFLVLIHKARSIGRPELLGPWLHGVAYRVATRARTRNATRREKERKAGSMRKSITSPAQTCNELEVALDGALQEIPEKYRTPLLLCYVEEKTHEEVARELGCPLGTVRSWVSRGRRLLRSRLARRGYRLSATALGAFLAARNAPAAVPAATSWHPPDDTRRPVYPPALRHGSSSCPSRAVPRTTGGSPHGR